MSVQTGTATNYQDLLDKLDTYVCANGWTSKRRVSGTEMIWSAPGAGSDSILVGARIFSSVSGDYFNWRLGGFTAFDAALNFDAQAGYTGTVNGGGPGAPVLNLWNAAIPYWFILNNRRVIVVAKVSTVYVVAYLGLLLTYISPGTFPYPLVVGGSEAFNNEPAAGDAKWRWSYVGNELSNFFRPFNGASISADPSSALRLRLPSGRWAGGHQDVSSASGTYLSVWPAYATHCPDLRTNLDGSYSVFPFVVHDPTPNVYGEFDGMRWTTGWALGAEDTITVSGTPYLIVPNVGRSTRVDFAAIALA